VARGPTNSRQRLPTCSAGARGRGEDALVLAAVDTDGRDGGTDAAGAIVDGVEDEPAARTALADNDSYRFLDERDALLRTGATGTNVDDLRVAVVGEPF